MQNPFNPKVKAAPVSPTAESETNDAGVHLNSSEMETETSESPRHRNRKRHQTPSKNDGYVVFVPPTFFKKISSNEKSTTFHKSRLNDFNVEFAAGKKSSVGTSGKGTQNLDEHLVDLKDPPLAKQIMMTQADLDTKIMKM
ncbi:hypothetical protein OUZ56_011021 [Daphnia magna]|uniref:Uncharacterized protein n=1 Tax=Daphnia magna TaxID=35525 RepID=A0ABQ9YZ68_9CRUS|nr:hypothetical protein OUZ56_011021 [Daphnia magna]